MAKFISTDWKVVVNNVDLSKYAFNIDTPQEREEVEVSGFGGSREYLPGAEDATLTVQFIQDYGTGGPHGVLYPLFATSGTVFPVYVQPFRAQGTSPTNPIFGGTASMFTYNGGAAALNERSEISCDFRPAPNSKFVWGTTAP
jgi:hypothetical protein